MYTLSEIEALLTVHEKIIARCTKTSVHYLDSLHTHPTALIKARWQSSEYVYFTKIGELIDWGFYDTMFYYPSNPPYTLNYQKLIGAPEIFKQPKGCENAT